MLRTGSVFDEPLRTPTYSIKFHTQAYFGFAEDTRLGRVCETQISKNTQAYFGDRRMLRTGSVFDEPLRTPTYSIKFHTQAYFGDRRMLRIGFVFDEPLRTPTYSTKFHTQAYRSGHNEAVLKTVRGNSHGGSNPSACAKK